MHEIRWIPVLCAVLALAGCDSDAAPMAPDAGEVPLTRAAVVLNSLDATLSLIPFADTAQARTLPLGVNPGPGETGAELEVRGQKALAVLGNWVVVADLASEVAERRFRLQGERVAAGAAFLSDTTALLAFAHGEPLHAINLASGAVRAVPDAGTDLGAVRVVGSRVYVAGTSPDGAGVLTVLDMTLRPVATVKLGGSRPRAMTVRGGQVLVLNGGAPGRAEGSVSVVDTASLREVSRFSGFGEGATSLALSSTGSLFVWVPGTGVHLLDFVTGTLTRAVQTPGSASANAGLVRVAADPSGAVYVLRVGNCTGPGVLERLDGAGAAVAMARTGRCPKDVEFASIRRR